MIASDAIPSETPAMPSNLFRTLTLLATVLALCVIVFGAYVRLSDAGLGCPDWPGCYGQLTPHHARAEIAQAEALQPGGPVTLPKAWKEMIHRYLASLLGLLILALAIVAIRQRHTPQQPVILPITLVGLVIFQGLLGMWTVTLLLKPVIVMGHLLGGLTILALLWWMWLQQALVDRAAPPRTALQGVALLGLVLLTMQIALGGWVSANYAALACPDFPTCQTRWWPPMNFTDAFTLWRGTGISYEGGVLDNDARVTVHVMHRLGAVIVTLYLTGLLIALWQHVQGSTRRWVILTTAGLLLGQVSLGIANILLVLPLPVAVAHNAGAALLLLALVTVNHLCVSGTFDQASPSTG